jgi:hypothetical protein
MSNSEIAALLFGATGALAGVAAIPKSRRRRLLVVSCSVLMMFAGGTAIVSLLKGWDAAPTARSLGGVTGPASGHLPNGLVDFSGHDEHFDLSDEVAIIVIQNVNGGNWHWKRCTPLGARIECNAIHFGDTLDAAGKWRIRIVVGDRASVDRLSQSGTKGRTNDNPTIEFGAGLRGASDVLLVCRGAPCTT